MSDANKQGTMIHHDKSVKGMKLCVSANKRYIVDQDGKPFFYLGDTAWTLFKRLNHNDVEEYLKNRAAKGFSVIQSYVVRGLRIPNIYGDYILNDRDPARPNEAFFCNVDYIVNRANNLGLVMGMVVSYGEHVRHAAINEQVFTVENAFAYGKFMGSRYKDNAVIWLLGGDRDPEEGKEIWISMAEGLMEGCSGTQLISYHGPGNPKMPSSSFWFHDEKWLDFNMIQSGHGWADPNYEFISHDYQLKPVKPTIDMESRYENHPDYRKDTFMRMDAHQAREAGYWAVLAGAAGHGYGCNDIWQFFDEAITPYLKDNYYPTNYPNTNWHVAMDFQGAYGVGYMRKLAEARPWYMMIPDQSVIAGGQGEGEDHIQAAIANDGSFIVAYLPFGNPVSISMDRLAGKAVKALWYNPREGSWSYISQYANSGVHEFIPPSCGKVNDWVLVLEDAGRNYPTE